MLPMTIEILSFNLRDNVGPPEDKRKSSRWTSVGPVNVMKAGIFPLDGCRE